MRKKFLFCMAAVATVMVGAAQPAGATPTITLQVTGCASSPLTGIGAVAISGYCGYSVSAFAMDNSPGTAASAYELSNTLDVQNTGTTADYLWVTVSDNTFTNPTGLLNLSSSFSATFNASADANIEFWSYANNGASLCVSTTCPGMTSGMQAITSNGSNNSQGAPTSDTAFTASAPFSLSEVYRISLGPGEGVSTEADTAASVPEPMTLAMFGCGLIGLGAMLRRHRTNRKTAQ